MNKNGQPLASQVTFKTLVLRQFETDVAMQLIEFGKSLRKIDADVLVFMARKSLCLYDVLLRLGIPPVENCVVSDRVLDMRLDKLKGKRVALIDDTLIVGTALAKTKKFLLDAGVASVSVHVFCIDNKWWCRELIEPDSVTMHLPDERVMTFCTATVRAMSLLPRPYLVDFPLSRPLKIPADEAQCFLSNVEWRAFNISTHFQQAHDVSALSFFPNADVQEILATLLGKDLWKLLDIVKVRGFARKQRDVYWLQMIPIVVLKPLTQKVLESALRMTLEKAGTMSKNQCAEILYYAHTPRAQQRLLQYVISSIVGHHFISGMKLSMSRPLRFGFDMRETDRHYGPWLHDPMNALTRCERLQYPPDHLEAVTDAVRSLAAADLPKKVHRWAVESLPPKRNGGHPGPSLFKRDEVANLIPDFSEIFISHYDRLEIPIRKEARKLGAQILENADALSPRNRLGMGLPWPVIVEHLLSLHNLERTPEVEQVFSLVLDFCNDQGIAVPITCVIDDVVFRAYRHGEDVKFTEAEVALAYEATKGFLDASRAKGIPKLKLEKLLVLLIKIGVAKNFLEPLLISTGGVQEVLRIGFYLRGAIPVLTKGPRDRADREIWFSEYLKKRGILTGSKKSLYELGEQVEGNYRVTTASDEAYELGHIIGILSQAKRDPARKEAPLDDNAITLLASCGTPRHAAAAIQVELDLFRDWFQTFGISMFRKLQWSKPEAVRIAYKKFLQGHSHIAIHAARLKYIGYKNNEPEKIIQICADYLREKHGETWKRKWLSYWKAACILEASGEKAVFDPMLDEAALVCWELALWVSVIEICLTHYLVNHAADPEASDYLQTALRKYDEYSRAMMSLSIEPPKNATKIHDIVGALGTPGVNEASIISILNSAIREITNLLPKVSRTAEVMNPMIEEYGRLVGRRDYQYMVYYDIIDSTGTRVGRTGADLSLYRSQVKRLKQFLNVGFRQLAQDAWKAATEVFCWNGACSSENDCKHVFIGGTSAGTFLQEVLHLMTRALEAVPSMRLRVYVLPCNFVGTTAYRQEWDTEVSGDRFWEHWSRLLTASKKYEEAVGPGKSFLLVAVEDLIQRIVLPKHWLWDSVQYVNIASEIELLTKTTMVKYGTLAQQARTR